MADTSRWTLKFKSNSDARLRLFCFPFAGGAASAFYGWQERLSDRVEVVAVQYPGRESRWREPAIDSADRLAGAILAGIQGLLPEKPYAFFGHSLGAMMSYEVARLIRTAQLPEPRRLFLSGRRAPAFRPFPPEMRHLPEDEFWRQLGELNGTPPEILANEELMDLLAPMLRADFTLDETYRHEPGPLLWQDFSIYGGEADDRIPEHELRAWADYTTGRSSFRLFPGDHFYLKDPNCGLYDTLNHELEALGI